VVLARLVDDDRLAGRILAAARRIARQTLEALGRRGTVRPGWLSKLLEAFLALLPRRGRSRMMGIVMGGMARHHP
jgi:hypothetical protein